MKEFSFLNYCTIYSAEFSNRKVKMRKSACFYDAFSIMRNQPNPTFSAKYRIKLYQGTDYMKETKDSNACLLNLKELKYHINQVSDIIPFKLKVEESTSGEHKIFIVTVSVHRANALQHKYLLSWIRYAYEFPHNVALFEARRLRYEKGFRFESGSTLFNLVSQSFYIWEPLHSIAYGNKVGLLSKVQLRKKLFTEATLNSIFTCYNDEGSEIIDSQSKIRKDLGCRDIEYWMDENLFKNERLPFYYKKLKRLKEEKIV